MSDSKYAPGIYVKGDDERVANSARDAVALVFEGFKPKADAPISEEEVEEPSAPADAPADAPVEVAQVDETPKPEAPKPRAPRNRPDVQED